MHMLRAERLEDAASLHGIRVGWADSSPQVAGNWLLALSDHVAAEDIPACYESSVALARAGAALCAKLPDPLTPEKRAAHEEVIQASVRRHAHVPSALGSGEASLSSKASALLHSHMLECPDLLTTKTFLRSYHAYCTDMGTEMGLAGFSSTSLQSCLPKYLRQGRLFLCPGPWGKNKEQSQEEVTPATQLPSGRV